MHCRHIIFSVLLFVLALPWSLRAEEPLPPPVYNIGIVTDGSTARDQHRIKVLKQEIGKMAEGEFRANFPAEMVLSGRDTAAGVRKGLQRLLADDNVDLVIALGPVASSLAWQGKGYDKPVLAPFVLSSVVEAAKSRGKDMRPANLAFIVPGYFLDREVLAMQKVVPFSHLALLLDRREVVAVPALKKMARRLANEHTMQVEVVAVGDSVQDALQALPGGTEAVMVGPLYHLDAAGEKALAQGLIQRRIAGFSLLDRSLVAEGLLAGDVPADMEEQLARRTAVAVQDILLGASADNLTIAFARGQDLTINMATARAIDRYPSLAVSTGANLLNEEHTDIKRRLTLQQAVSEALQANLDLHSARKMVAAGAYGVREARGALLPQLGVATGAAAIDEDRARLAGGASPERSWTGSATLAQQLYSERNWAGYQAEQHNQMARQRDLDMVRLDITHQASVAYLNVLRAKTIEQLYKDNLKLTLANLDRARIRMSTGVAGPDEVYRWETKFATDKMQVLERESITLDAMQGLNRILHRPLQERFMAEETQLSDPLLMVGDKLFFELMNNPRHLQAFRDFSVQEALAARPELHSMDAAIRASERLHTAARRELWLPEFSVEGRVDQYFAEDGAGQRQDMEGGLDDTDWQIGLFARLPLYAGGSQAARSNRTSEEAARLRIQRQALAERIGQDMLAALNRTRASYPGISLSREAAEAARRNLDLITDSYIQGIKSIIDLLDAQNQALTADQAAANAVYNFLVDLMGVQRAMGRFIIFQPKEKRDAWFDRALTYLQGNGNVTGKE